MRAKVKAGAFDFSSCSVDEAKGAILARLAPSGPGHTLYCLTLGSAHATRTGCRYAPVSWRPPAALAAALDALKVSGAVVRVGAYLWLRPGRTAVIAGHPGRGIHGVLPNGDSGRAQRDSLVR